MSQGVSGIGRGWSSLEGGEWMDLVQRHMSQVETYLPMYLDTSNFWRPIPMSSIFWDVQQVWSCDRGSRSGNEVQLREHTLCLYDKGDHSPGTILKTSWRLLEFLDHHYDYLFLVIWLHSMSDLLQDVLFLSNCLQSFQSPYHEQVWSEQGQVPVVICSRSMVCSVGKSSYKTAKRPQLDQTKTAKDQTSSLSLSVFRIKDRKKTGLLRPVLCGWNQSEQTVL